MDSAPQPDDAPELFATSDDPRRELSAEEGLEYLGELLRETDSQSASKLPIGIRAILQTAKKYPTASVTDPIVAQELVASILRDHWGEHSPPPEHAAAMHSSISSALLEDPIASARLVRLWNHVVERINDN